MSVVKMLAVPLVLTLLGSACSAEQQVPAAAQAPPAQPAEEPLPNGWSRVDAGKAWFDLAPSWAPAMQKIVAQDDPHRRLRLRVGCDEPDKPISAGLANLPGPASQSKFRLETLGAERVFEFKASGQDFVPFPDSYQVVSAMRMPGITRLAASADPITYGILFDLEHLEEILQRPEVKGCRW